MANLPDLLLPLSFGLCILLLNLLWTLRVFLSNLGGCGEALAQVADTLDEGLADKDGIAPTNLLLVRL
jgi:hypothetical protein